MQSVNNQHGFNLLEVMIALAILAFLMAGVTNTQGAALMHGSRVANLSVATQLIDGIILDLEEEYRLDGFPDNSLENRDCELPRGFDNFRCEYDLVGLDVGSDNISSMGGDAMENVSGSPLMSALCSGGPSGADVQTDLGRVMADLGDQHQGMMGPLNVLADPMYMEACGVNMAQMCANIPMMASFIPAIIEEAAKATRKLVIRLSWDERGRAEKTLVIESFITSVPEAEEPEK